MMTFLLGHRFLDSKNEHLIRFIVKFSYLKFAFLLCCTTNGFSQEPLVSQSLLNTHSGQLYEFDRSDKTIQGTPYIEEAFFPARITANVEQIFNTRYNAVNGEIEVETEKNKTI